MFPSPLEEMAQRGLLAQYHDLGFQHPELVSTNNPVCILLRQQKESEIQCKEGQSFLVLDLCTIFFLH